MRDWSRKICIGKKDTETNSTVVHYGVGKHMLAINPANAKPMGKVGLAPLCRSPQEIPNADEAY